MSASAKVRILYVNHTGHVSGAEKVLLSILQGLDRTRFTPWLLCPAGGELAAEAQALGVELIPLPPVGAQFTWRPDRVIQSVISIFKPVMGIRKQIRSVAPDFIHANSVRAGIASSLAVMGTGMPVVWHVHDSLPRHPLSSAIRLFVFLARSTRVIAVSNASARRMRGLLLAGKRVRTIYNGVDLSRFPSKQSGSSDFRERFHIPDEDFLVCAVGQICIRKGLLELVGAFRQIHPQAPHMHLAIIGKVVFQHEEEYLEALHAAANESGIKDYIYFTGQLHDVSSALQAADLLVLNSRDEPFGLVLVEAMASGTPVLATRVGGVPEVVTDSENGWLIDSGDTAALSQKLLELSRNRELLLQVAHTAQTTTCPRFALQRFQNDLAKFYSELVPDSDAKWSAHNLAALARSGND